MTITLDCGCTVDVMVELAECPLHAAAGDLLAACKRAAGSMRGYCRMTGKSHGRDGGVIAEIETAIAKAEPKETGR